jgi:UDP-N-acetylglucosamine 4,6-dehydratase/5-epimerase
MDWQNKIILVTGGTGSFGHKFTEIMLARHKPKRVIVFSRDEQKQHEMRLHFNDSRLNFFIGDVRDRDRLYRAFQARVDMVVHAAALKQVPACEYNPFEAIKTNVIGAANIIDAAIDCGIPKVLALSSDKAVNPVNLYGATKLCAEKLFVQGNSYAGGKTTRFSCVRYGNVVASRGSVIPLFLAQKNNGAITITDRRMTRFWLTLDQGVDFVIRCMESMRGGEVFVPRIPSMGIFEMAQAVAPACKIKFTGIRPGEKLHETLLSADEARHSVALEGMFVIQPEFPTWGRNNWVEGKPLPEGFTFSSDNNDRWMTASDIAALMEGLANGDQPAHFG